jgi:hypothetical protein
MQIYLAIFALLVIGGILLALVFIFVANRQNSPTVFNRRLATVISSVMVLAAVVLAEHFVLNGLGDLAEKLRQAPVYVFLAIVLYLVIHEFIARSMPSRDLHSRPRTQTTLTGLEQYEWRHGFVYYRNWIKGLGKLGRAIERVEPTFIKDLFFNVFYHGPFDLVMPKNITHTTVFLFSKKEAVKLQRIRGQRQLVPDIGASKVYLPQTCSTESGKTRGLHLIRRQGGIVEAAFHDHGEWRESQSDSFDMMLLALYENDESEIGDYVYVDIPKYVDLKKHHTAVAEIAIIADREIELFDVWEVSASLDITERPVPLMFRDIDNRKKPMRKPRKIKSNFREVSKMLRGWDVLLDAAFRGQFGNADENLREEIREFLRKVQRILVSEHATSETPLRDSLRTPAGRDCVTWQQESQRNVILTTFTWGKKKS